ncbi:hypothetical protein J9303_03755 [Bacillaceae bacterium Marseille-Q3522]|nr:hypothetical protein [Bacillaceae bacterium Marseille-Q3522]
MMESIQIDTLPIASLEKKYQETIITCVGVAPSKTFKLADLQASCAIIANKKLRVKFAEELAVQGLTLLNTFASTAIEAAYRCGESWLEELLVYLKENIAFSKQFIAEKLPRLTVMEPEGTYILWIGYHNLHLTKEAAKEKLLTEGKLAVELGEKFGQGGEGFIRMNIACPKETLQTGLEQLQLAFSAPKKQETD